MIQTTRWSPDTCGCVVEFQWDSELATEQRVHTPSKVVSVCPSHQNLDITTHWGKLRDENPRKNKLLEKMRSLYPAQFDTKGQFLGSWSFDSNRVLTIVTTPGLTNQQKNTAQNWCDTNLGAGKVIIQ